MDTIRRVNAAAGALFVFMLAACPPGPNREAGTVKLCGTCHKECGAFFTSSDCAEGSCRAECTSSEVYGYCMDDTVTDEECDRRRKEEPFDCYQHFPIHGSHGLSVVAWWRDPMQWDLHLAQAGADAGQDCWEGNCADIATGPRWDPASGAGQGGNPTWIRGDVGINKETVVVPAPLDGEYDVSVVLTSLGGFTGKAAAKVVVFGGETMLACESTLLDAPSPWRVGTVRVVDGGVTWTPAPPP